VDGCFYSDGILHDPFSGGSIFQVLNRMSRRLLILLVLVGVAGVLVWLGLQTYQEFHRAQAVQQEIDQLEREGSRIRQENASLKNNIEYFKTSDFQEREAKEKLNYQENGEHVVIFQPGAAVPEKKVSFSENSGSVAGVVFRKPNYQLWLEQFFDF
jgi:cell division protein FtsB